MRKFFLVGTVVLSLVSMVSAQETKPDTKATAPAPQTSAEKRAVVLKWMREVLVTPDSDATDAAALEGAALSKPYCSVNSGGAGCRFLKFPKELGVGESEYSDITLAAVTTPAEGGIGIEGGSGKFKVEYIRIQNGKLLPPFLLTGDDQSYPGAVAYAGDGISKGFFIITHE